MWITLLAACTDLFPELEWMIDHTLVPAIRVLPGLPDDGTTRTVEALVLSPWDVESVAVEICGFDPTIPEYIVPECFAEPSLVEQVADELPAEFTLAPLTFECPPYEQTDSGVYVSYGCASTIPLRVRATTARDAGFGIVNIDVFGTIVYDSAVAPGSVDLRIDVVSGEVVPGGEVVLDASEANVATGDLIVRWYVDDGELLNTGRTYYTGRNADRLTTRNVLRIPEEWHGPLRVAVVTRAGWLWTVSTLEVP